MKEEKKGFSISADVTLSEKGAENVKSLMKELDEKQEEERRKVSNLLDSKFQRFVGTNSELFTEYVKKNGKQGENFVQLIMDVYQNALAVGWNTCYKYYEEKIEKV